ncbi:uncharacterized protein C4orf45 [Aplysia californica]|uniref:Uncharacterized protein C4orf45 n=1 Tax=Aplysia californica TaxID=6500 RepID=A0ABM1W307_APLCA|nr:uncharacterized protein C4orf45 [Aplysia californica]
MPWDYQEESPQYNYVDNVFPYAYPSSGNVTFTGPDGLRDYRPHMITDPHQVGVGDQSTEHSGDVAYVFRPAPGTPMPRPRSCIPGEIGWGIPTLTDWATPNTGQQIMGTHGISDKNCMGCVGAILGHPINEIADSIQRLQSP